MRGDVPPPRPADRDRDRHGRPRSTRPRDTLGRPLAREAARGPLPGEPELSWETPLAPWQALELAQELIASGRPFHAHEVLETAWKTSTGDGRGLWRGLTQISVGLTHARRGNRRGAVALLRRGAEAMVTEPKRNRDGHAGGDWTITDLDTNSIRSAAVSLADRIERNGLTGLTDADLTLRLIP